MMRPESLSNILSMTLYGIFLITALYGMTVKANAVPSITQEGHQGVRLPPLPDECHKNCLENFEQIHYMSSTKYPGDYFRCRSEKQFGGMSEAKLKECENYCNNDCSSEYTKWNHTGVCVFNAAENSKVLMELSQISDVEKVKQALKPVDKVKSYTNIVKGFNK
eukprot:Nk52_evm34s32 gene=Nk52_evmTU34s32